MQSARRPGAIEPSSRSSPKCVAVLIVAICSATSGSSPQSIACRTTRSMCPSLTSVPEWQSSVQRMKLRGSSPFSVTAVICAFTSYQAEPEPQHRPHPLAHPRDRVRLARALVVVGRPAGGIGREVGRGPGWHSARRPSCRRACVAAISPSIFGSPAITPG